MLGGMGGDSAVSLTWTTEQVLALAPDAASAKAGRELATPRKWVSLGRDRQSAWGLCQGSGKSPYQTQIDLGEPAFRCSCPSRKFPCKHSLGLFLLLAAQPEAFPEQTPPAWVTEWLEARAKRAEQRAAKSTRKEEPADPAAQERRAARRESRVAAGLQELDLWLCDLVRSGLASAQGKPPAFWEGIAARLVDAQAPGLARLVRDLSSLPASGTGWQERLLERLSLIYLLIEGYRRIDTLPAETQADLRSLIGWTQSQETLLAEPGLSDHWAILGQRIEQEEHLRVQRTWLQGTESGRPAMILHFAHGTAPLDTSLVPGTCFNGEVVFFPGAYPLRALIKSREGAAEPLQAMGPGQTIASAAEARAAALARNPWISRFPVLLETVVPTYREGTWVLRDTEGSLLPLHPRFDRGWQLLALSGGYPLALFGEWEEDHFLPLSAWADSVFLGL
jgi:hypothetical protein